MLDPLNLPSDRSRGLVAVKEIGVPNLIRASGEEAAHHFINFFIASIRNPHTRRAYARHVRTFMEWCEARGVADVRGIKTPHVSAYIELLSRSELEAASVKQVLSALRMLFDWLVVHQVVLRRPQASTRPTHPPTACSATSMSSKGNTTSRRAK